MKFNTIYIDFSIMTQERNIFISAIFLFFHVSPCLILQHQVFGTDYKRFQLSIYHWKYIELLLHVGSQIQSENSQISDTDYVLLETGNLGFCLNFTNNMCLKTLDVFQSQDNLED